MAISEGSKKRSSYLSYQNIAKFLAVFALFFVVCFGKLDPDFGWHLQSGKHYLESWIPQNDIFTYTASNFEWINHEWFSDILLSLLYGAGGYLLLAVFYALLWSLALFIAAPRARLLTLLLGAGALMPYAGIRPIAWTALFFTALIKVCTNKSDKVKMMIPLLFLAWANMHGGFIIGLFVIGYYAVKNRDKVLLYSLPVSLLVTLINPYGLKLYEEISRTLFDSSLRFQIVEWLPVAFWGSTVLFIAIWAVGFALFDSKKIKNWINLPVIFLLSGFMSTRNMPFFVLTAIKDIDRYYDNFVAELPKKGTKNIMRARNLVIYSMIFIVLAWLGYANRHVTDYLAYDREDNYPASAIYYINANGCQGNIFNSYDYGGYVIWKLPDHKVYIDGRMPSWEQPNGGKYMDTYFDVFKDEKIRQEEFTKHGIKCAIINDSETKFIDSLKTEGWEVKNNDNNTILLISP